ncbi:hypothetical protein BOTBODRAFT_493055 [Botryobasidium botryosum FD-172 SS1]|uniref:F-box domain-containing protein n=1 Tax=Botryobasidium botryosum (strain FD-172 SS1) TaxID=930990 RepID=A0A067MF54_BOTB1|nr:hypothetical protein BOTBODRAFT_493055 [Botryobasidium botryosum FD-172 SS1]
MCEFNKGFRYPWGGVLRPPVRGTAMSRLLNYTAVDDYTGYPQSSIGGVELPNELFDYIFLLGTNGGRDTRFALRVSQVCRHWRNLALTSARLWAHIQLQPSKLLVHPLDTDTVLGQCAAQLARARGAPLSLRLALADTDLPAASDADADLVAKLTSLCLCLRVVTHALPRLRALELEIGWCASFVLGYGFARQVLAKIEEGPTPWLEEVEIHLHGLRLDRVLDLPVSRWTCTPKATPRLKSVSVVGARLDVPLPHLDVDGNVDADDGMFENVERLQYAPSRIQSDRLLCDLSLFPNLTTLAMSISEKYTVGVADAAVLCLERLEVLSVCFVDGERSITTFSRLWELLSLPRLHTLELDSPRNFILEEPAAFVACLRNSASTLSRLERFCISRISMGHRYHRDLFRAMPNLIYLRLYPDVMADDRLIIQGLSLPIDGSALPCPNLEEIVVGSEEVSLMGLASLLLVRARRGGSSLCRVSTPRWKEFAQKYGEAKSALYPGIKVTSCDLDSEGYGESIRRYYTSSLLSLPSNSSG